MGQTPARTASRATSRNCSTCAPELRLVRDAIVGTEVIELHPFAALMP
jgi:hypothetical protein